MKRYLCLILILFLFCGCGSFYPDDYLSVETNQAPYAYRETSAPVILDPSETEEIPTQVSTVSEIRKGIQELVNAGITTGRFKLKGYRGEIKNLPETVRKHLISYSPKYIYAMKDLDLELVMDGENTFLDVSYVPTMSTETFKAIQTVRYPEAESLIFAALRDHLSTFIVEITGYEETDYFTKLNDYILDNPNEIIEVPKISIQKYPEQENNIRVLKIDFRYKTDAVTFKWQQKTVQSLLETYQVQFSEEDDPRQLLDILYSILVPVSGYVEDENATAYTLFLREPGSSRTGNSRMMASVAAYFCVHAGKDCGVVEGERKRPASEDQEEAPEWEKWYWNWIRDGDQFRFFDLHSAALSEKEPVLLKYEEMKDYRWDTEKYPELEPTKPSGPNTPPETEPTEEPTEDTVGETKENFWDFP